MNKNLFKIGFWSMLMSLASCSQEEIKTANNEQNEIEGVAQAPLSVDGYKTSRTVVAEDDESFSLWWAVSESIGVYGSSLTNSKYTSSNSSNAQSVSFKGGSFFKTPKYAYYPYSSANSSNAQTAVQGALEQVQTWDASDAKLAGDFKIGTYKSRSWTSTTFTFSNVLTYVKMAIDATGTVLEGDKLQSITLTAGNARQLWGAFQANLTNSTLTWNGTEENLNTATLEWTATPALSADATVTGYMVAAPSIKQGDVISFLVKTENYQAAFSLTSSVDYSANLQVVYAMPLAEMSDVVYMNAAGDVIENTIPDVPEVDEPTEEDPIVTPEAASGIFTCATYNVDGLPQKISFVSINSDGPGASGTNSISAKIAQQNWDFVGFSEDFAYHSNLISSLSSYQWGTYRGSISSSALYKTIDTDGLEFAANKTTCSWSEENIVAFTSSNGGLTSGANTCIKKGFRHYPVTVAEGVVVDVIITHMNTYSSSGSGHINAQHAQLKQIAQYINNLVATNNRPVILMGDTNCRYTRHDFQTYFWGVLSSNLTYADPWVDFQWNGVYPTYPSNSLMVSDATGTSSSDIICADTQKGEVVDKIIYINNPNAPVQIKAQSYLRDYDNFNGLADHMPIVVTFSYEKAAQ